ncbi:hypothetical protein ACI780_19915 [Geodermatophilus sp. SYSU D00814]
MVVVDTCAAAPTGMANKAKAPAMTAAIRFFRILLRPHVAPGYDQEVGSGCCTRARRSAAGTRSLGRLRRMRRL